MKFFAACGLFMMLLNLGACANSAGQHESQGGNQFYGKIQGGIESSHTTH